MRRFAALAFLLVVSGAASAQKPDPADPLKGRIHEEIVKLDLKDTPLAEVLRTIALDTGFSIVLDPRAQSDGKPAADVRVTGVFHNVPVDDFLKAALKPLKLCHFVYNGVVLVSDGYYPDLSAMDPNLPREIVNKLAVTTLTLESKGEPLSAVAGAVARQPGYKLKYNLRPGRKPSDIPVHLYFTGLSVSRALDWLALFQDLTWTVEGDAIVFTDRLTAADVALVKKMKQTKVTCQFDGVAAGKISEFLVTTSGFNIVLGSGFMDKKVTLNMTGVPLEDAVNELARSLGLRASFFHGSLSGYSRFQHGVLILTDDEGMKTFDAIHDVSLLPEKPSKLDSTVETKLEDTTVTFAFSGQPAADAFGYLAQVGNVSLVLGPATRAKRDEKLSFALTNVSLRTALEISAGQTGLCLAVRDGVVIVSDRKEVENWHLPDPEMPVSKADSKAPETAAIQKALRDTKTSCSCINQSARVVLEDFARPANLTLECDPDLLAGPADTIYLNLKDISIGTALHLALDQLGLTAVILDGKLVVTPKPAPAPPPKAKP